VTLLVLGLTAGSSSLLISSIVASLLAAVALVIGARQAASARRSAVAGQPEPAFPADDDSYGADPAYGADPVFAAEPEFAAASASTTGTEADPSRRSRRSDDPPSTGAAFAADSPGSSADVDDQAHAHRETVQFEPVAEHVQGDLSADEARQAGRRDTAAGLPADTDPDYDRAFSAINAARSETPNDNTWHHDPAAASADPAEEFAEPDLDDPSDEPLPQSVSPSDAVRVARLDAEVLVVDGRPRYHMADCPHLVGRLTEPVPVNEAVELGFTPCGLCRPVDRLVAAATHH
jgi:hypothetical protein